MRSRLGKFLPLLLLALAACTRQADGPFEPVTGDQPTDIAAAVTPTESIFTQEGLPTLEESTDFLTEEADEFTVTEEAFNLEPTLQDTSATDEAPIIFTLEATQTPTDEPFDFTVTEEVEVVEETTSFITPGSPSSDLMEGGAQTPEVGAGDATPTGEVAVGGEETDTDNGGDNLAGVDENCIYTVQRGDTLFRIAVAEDTTITALREANPDIANTDTIFPGQELLIPDCDDEDGEETAVEPDPTETTAPPAGTIEHTVRSGESLYTIAQRYSVTIQQIVDANELADPNRLSVGQVLLIPQE